MTEAVLSFALHVTDVPQDHGAETSQVSELDDRGFSLSWNADLCPCLRRTLRIVGGEYIISEKHIFCRIHFF